ncbi:LOW QUALITY PROTEIN: LORF2-like protein, partial [Mya arenaria]
DFNTSLHRNKPNPEDRLLEAFLRETALTPDESYPENPTFFHHNGRDTAQIDYIFTNLENTTIRIKEHESTNTSDHTLVLCSVPCTLSNNHSNKKLTNSNLRKPKWHKCHKSTYQNVTENLLNTERISIPSSSPSLIELDIIHLENVLHSATNEAIPGHQKPTSKPRGKGIWSPEIQAASRRAKVAFGRWKDGGKSRDTSNNLYSEMRNNKKYLRRAQRQHAANKRNSLYEEIMESHNVDSKAFFKLINKQRSQPQHHTETLLTDSGLVTSESEILDTWKEHFNTLATPSCRPHYDNTFKRTVELEMLCIEDLIENKDATTQCRTTQQVEKAISQLKNNKAEDARGLTAEHFKLSSQAVVKYVTRIINNIITSRTVPKSIKEGILTPVPKKNKDQRLTNSYRGITVTTVLSKILENTLEPEIKQCINPTINRLQRGFTENTSPNNAALIVTECINEAMDNKTPLALATLDAEKAFDVVWHDGLFRKLYHNNLPLDIWMIIRDLQTNAPTKVKWQGNISDPFSVQQGIRQGAKLSPILYKTFNNGLLESLDHNRIGAKIGTTYAGAPTVADDIALLSTNPADLTAALQLVHKFNSKDRANINTTKSEIVIYNSDKKREPQHWNIGNSTIHETESTTHLGILRHHKQQQNITCRIGTGRRAMYSLMGADLHGRNGINPTISLHMYVTFARPRIIYGLETIHLTQKDLNQLASYEAKLMRQIQYLPDRCSSAAVYSLIGATPISTQIDINALTLFGNILRNPDTAEYEIARRQLAIKQADSHSWFMNIRRILSKYNLPSAYDLLDIPPTRDEWKEKINLAVNNYWAEQWEEDKQRKSSLKFLLNTKRPNFKPTPIVVLDRDEPSAKAVVKARVLTGTYTLQANKHKFNQHLVNPTCTLCNLGPEDREHFLTQCLSLQHARQKHIIRLAHTLTNELNIKVSDTITNNPTLLTQCILDCSAPTIRDIIGNNSETLLQVERISRQLVYDLHSARNFILKKQQCQPP